MKISHRFSKPSQGMKAVVESPKGGFDYFKKFITKRENKKWLSKKPVPVLCSCGIKKVATGHLPIGLLNTKDIIGNDEQRKQILKSLSIIADTKYNSTDPNQRVRCWGNPLVDFPTISEYLEKALAAEIEEISKPLVQNLTTLLRDKFGFKVEPLTDAQTGKAYQVGVFRAINVVNQASVLHVDDIIRDGSKKPDFKLPYPLMNESEYYQISFNILLDDGGFDADSLFTFNQFYQVEDETQIMPNGWQFPLSLVKDVDVCEFKPKIGDCYVFSTSCFHDIRGGSPRANRITWSCFGLYIPKYNLIYLYN